MIGAKILGEALFVDSMIEKSAQLRGALRQSIARECFRLEKKVKQDKLSGQVLNRRTGRGSRSVNSRVVEDSQGVTGYVGTNVGYMAMHEQGGEFTVKEHLRLVKKAWGRALKTPVWAVVKSHKMNVAKRSFLVSALEEMKVEIHHNLNADVNKVLT